MDVSNPPEPSSQGRKYRWEPEVDYDEIREPYVSNASGHGEAPDALQTIGDLLFHGRDYNPKNFAEFTHNDKLQGLAASNGPHGGAGGGPYSGAPHLEEDAEGNPKTFKRVLVRFAERTSMQGVPYIYVSSVWYAKLAWTVLFLVGFGLMVAHLYLLIEEFYKYETHSTVTLGFSTLTFPAVTICNVNPIKSSTMGLATPQLRALVESVQPSNIAGSMETERMKKEPPDGQMPADQSQQAPDQGGEQQSSNQGRESGTNGGGSNTGGPPSRKRRSLSSIHEEIKLRRSKRFIDGFSIEESNTRYKDDPLPEQGGVYEGFTGNKSTIRTIEDEFRFLFSSMGRDTREAMGHSIDDMLMECTFKGITCTPEQFRLVQTAQYGNCYTLQNDRFISTLGGPNDGLTLYLFTEDTEYLHGITNSLGFQVHIHNSGEFPNPFSEGLSVAAGAETFIGLKRVNIQRQKAPYGDCVDNEVLPLYNLSYTQQICKLVCLQSTIVETCSCYDAENDELFHKIAKSLGQADNLTMARPCISEDESTCLRSVLRQFQNDELSCDCPSPCSESSYDKSLSSRVWPTTEYASILVEYLCANLNETLCEAYQQKSRTELAVSFLKMVIYFEDLNYENITEEVNYETFQFVSDIGGTIGLWIGLSMISFFEVIQFLYEIAHYVFYMKPRLAAERARKMKQRQAKRDVVHALRFISPSGLFPPMGSPGSKLSGSLSGSMLKMKEKQVQGNGPKSRGRNPPLTYKTTSSGSTEASSGRGYNSLSSENDERQLLSGLKQQGENFRGYKNVYTPLQDQNSGRQNMHSESKGSPWQNARSDSSEFRLGHDSALPWHTGGAHEAYNPAFRYDQLPCGMRDVGVVVHPSADIRFGMFEEKSGENC